MNIQAYDPNLDDERLLDTEDVLSKIGYSRTWLDERIAEGTFPAPVHKWRRNKWRKKVVDEWIRQNFGADQAASTNHATAHAAH